MVSRSKEERQRFLRWLDRIGMGIVWLALLVVLAGLIFAIILNLRPAKTPSADQIKKMNESLANRTVKSILYIKDPRTGLCFASTYIAYDNLALTCVPCEAIPPDLLVVAEVKP